MRHALALLLCGYSLLSVPAHAQGSDEVTRNAARSLGAAGVEAYEQGSYAAASEKLDKAYRVLKVPSLGLWSARALVKLDRLVEAVERYQELQRIVYSEGDAEIQQRAKQEAASEQQALELKIPSVVVSVENAPVSEVKVSIDGIALVSDLLGEKRPLNPGKHEVVARYGQQTIKQSVVLAPAESKPVTLRFQNASATLSSSTPLGQRETDRPGDGSTRRTLGFVTLGVGGAGLVLGGIAGGLAVSKKGAIDDLGDDRCRNDVCLYSEKERVDSYSMWRTVSSVGLIAGTVLAASGVVLIVTAPKKPEVALRLGPGQLTFSRRF